MTNFFRLVDRRPIKANLLSGYQFHVLLCFRVLCKKKYYFDFKGAKATATITSTISSTLQKPPLMILISLTAIATTRIISKAWGSIPSWHN